MRILAHRLHGDDRNPVPYLRSPNQGPGTVTPEFLVMHYTAGASAESSIRSLTDPAHRASAHLVIGRDGAVTQLVDFNRRAWHAGVSRWDGRNGVNEFSIGIELDNVGVLSGEPGSWRTWFGRTVPDGEVLVAQHKNSPHHPATGWHLYTEAQLASALQVATALVAHYNLRDVIGHDDIAPGRKTDPGPAFPMDSFRAAAMGRADDAPEIYETTTALNIRTGPGTEFDKLAASPLAPGTRLEAIRDEGVWREVDVLSGADGAPDLTGWVHTRYVRRVV